MKKPKLEPLRPQTARVYRYLEVPKELLENEDYADLDDGAKLLYSKMLETAGLSAQHLDKFTDKNGRMFIYYTVEKMQHDLNHSKPTIVKLTKQLVDKGLIEKVRQGQGKPSRIYIFDFATAPHNKPIKRTVKDFNPIELNNKDLENKDLHPTDPPAGGEDGGIQEPLDIEEVQAQVRRQVEYTVLCENYDEQIADEVVEIITEVSTQVSHGPCAETDGEPDLRARLLCAGQPGPRRTGTESAWVSIGAFVQRSGLMQCGGAGGF